jgi:LPS sulfotransferase NodH
MFKPLILMDRPLPAKTTFYYYHYLKTSLIQRYKRLAHRLKPGSLNYTRFIILSAPRSGSTLLHTYLNSNLHIQSLGEEPWRDLEQGAKKEYFKEYPKLIQAVGLKTFYQFSVDEPYRKLYTELIKDKELRVIHLIRENKLEQYVSEVSAWKKREWTTKKGPDNKEKIKLDLSAFEAYIAQQKSQQEQSLKDFEDNRRISLSYEELRHEPQQVLSEVQSFLGVTPRKLFTVMEKQAAYSLADLLENAEEVRGKYPEFISKP